MIYIKYLSTITINPIMSSIAAKNSLIIKTICTFRWLRKWAIKLGLWEMIQDLQYSTCL